MPHVLLIAIVALVAAAAVWPARAVPVAGGGDRYNAAAFVVKHAWVKFAYVAGEPFRGELSREEEYRRLARFFELNRLIASAERKAGDPATSDDARDEAIALARQLVDERAGMENSVERIIEGRLTAAVREAGLTRHVGRAVVWPPVAIEFEDPPAVLVKSPRAEIRKESQSLLSGQLSAERVAAIEARTERDGETSALVVNISAIATYPAIIPFSADYASTLETAAHEWLHHYLYFTPLGRRYYESAKLTTLNETVANMGGRELGALAAETDPLDTTSADGPVAAPRTPGVDFVATMRQLRRDVEALLTQGDIEGAEQLMDERRAFLAANGYYLRRLNQAYFAFHGSYADSAGSIDPIGPKLQRLRESSGSLERFIETARGITSEEALDAALE